MRRPLAVVTALVTVGATGCFGSGIAAADDTQAGWTPDQGHRTTGHHRWGRRGGVTHWGARTFWAFPMTSTSSARARTGSRDWIGRSSTIPRVRFRDTPWNACFQASAGLDDSFPGLGIDGPSIGESVDEGEGNLETAIRNGGPGTAIGLSEGAMVLDAVQAKLAYDPTAPPPNQLSFATYGDPLAKHAFGESFLTQMFPVGSVVPSLDFRMPPPVESQYDTYQFVSAYDSIADWPDRPDNWMSLANAIVGLATGHTAVAFTNPSMVPPQNIRTTVNSKGAKTTTYLIPEQHLPLVLPFKYLGVDEGTLNQLDGVLQAHGGRGIFTKRQSADRSDHGGSGDWL